MLPSRRIAALAATAERRRTERRASPDRCDERSPGDGQALWTRRSSQILSAPIPILFSGEAPLWPNVTEAPGGLLMTRQGWHDP
jgi:hypothetical protein